MAYKDPMYCSAQAFGKVSTMIDTADAALADLAVVP